MRETDTMKKFLMLFSVVPTVLSLSACADTISATPDEITIVQVFSIGGSDPAGREAAAHCAQFGKDARLTGETGRIKRYDCVIRP